jgi:hypothetical protein
MAKPAASALWRPARSRLEQRQRARDKRGSTGPSPASHKKSSARRRASHRRVRPPCPADHVANNEPTGRHQAAAHQLPARPQHLDLPGRAGGLAGPRHPRRLPLQRTARLQRPPGRPAAGPGRTPLRRGRARRLHPAPAGRHLVRPRAGARGHRAAQPLRHAHRLRPDAQHHPARRLPHGLPGARRAGRPHRAGRGPPPADGRHQRHALRQGRRAGLGRKNPRQGRRLLPRPQHRPPSWPPPPTAASPTSA